MNKKNENLLSQEVTNEFIKLKMKFKFYLTLISVCLLICYQIYLRFPQQYKVGTCTVDSQTNEVYRVISKAKRSTSFKDHWFFAPMTIEIKAVKTNPNTLHKLGEIKIIEQDDHFFNLYPCSEN